MPFCVNGAGEDLGAGQFYINVYYFTTFKNGNYITLPYLVHTPDTFCSPYKGSSDYQSCTNFMENYYTNVTQAIEHSVNTLKFNK